MKQNIKHTTTNNAPLYGLGLVGALVYYIGAASGFWGVIIGIGKSLFWPAFLVYEVLKVIHT